MYKVYNMWSFITTTVLVMLALVVIFGVFFLINKYFYNTGISPNPQVYVYYGKLFCLDYHSAS